MKCPYCSSDETKVVDKRPASDVGANRRRRECIKCGKRFTTYERIEMNDLIIIKKDGRREKFDRDKLASSIVKSCEKRPISYDKITDIVNGVERDLRKLSYLNRSYQKNPE